MNILNGTRAIKRFFSILLILCTLCGIATAKHLSAPNDTTRDIRPVSLQIGGFHSDKVWTMKSARDVMTFEEPFTTPHRSPFLAGALSLAIPGAGEVYTGYYLKAGIFFALEVLGWYFNISYNNKGDNQTDYFQNYADTHWSAVRYAEWLNTYAATLPGGDKIKDVKITINPNPALQPWERVDWDAIHKIESAIPEFSHQLPAHGEQQYFELIGKYQQYNHGWDDSEPNTPVYYTNLSKNFLDYAQMRGKANDYYATAKTVVSLILLNHVVSAIDAIWSASLFNRRYQFHSRVLMQQTQFGYEAVPTFSFSMKF